MIKDNIQIIRNRIAALCSRLQKDPFSVTIVAVGKQRIAEDIREVIAEGITDIGENRVQEALVKQKKLLSLLSAGQRSRGLRWHMVGHLQSNKVKQAVGLFDLIHSVDSVKLAAEIDKEACKINKIQEILIQVNTSFEETKFGIQPDDLVPVALEILRFRNISLKGLMTIAPMTDDQEKVRGYFRKLKELSDRLNAIGDTCLPAGRRSYTVPVISMGMSDDFEVAVEEGATMIRIGRSIFEDR